MLDPDMLASTGKSQAVFDVWLPLWARSRRRNALVAPGWRTYRLIKHKLSFRRKHGGRMVRVRA